MKHLVYYNPGTGFIISHKSVNEDLIEENRPAGSDYIESAAGNSQDHYVDSGEVADRPLMALSEFPISAEMNEPFVITGLPEGTKIHFQGQVYDITDEEFEWDTNVPGRYFFQILNFPYKEECFYVQIQP
jgi:hypothetical protein